MALLLSFGFMLSAIRIPVQSRHSAQDRIGVRHLARQHQTGDQFRFHTGSIRGDKQGGSGNGMPARGIVIPSYSNLERRPHAAFISATFVGFPHSRMAEMIESQTADSFSGGRGRDSVSENFPITRYSPTSSLFLTTTTTLMLSAEAWVDLRFTITRPSLRATPASV